MTMLAETAAFVEAFCTRHGVGRDNGLRLTLIVEELFTNTVVHGHGGDCDAPVDVTLSKHAGEVAVLYEDTAPAHDPTAALRSPRPELTADVESRTIGGLGIHLMGQLVRRARYEYADGRNRLWLDLALRA